MQTIFINRDSLSPSYIPKKLPHREKQLKFLQNLFGEAVKWKSHLRCIQLVGGVGSGKTATAKRFSETLIEEAEKWRNELRVAYINLRKQGPSRFLIFNAIAEQLTPEISVRGFGPEEMLNAVIKFLTSTKKLGLIIVDEVDYHCKRYRKEKIIYDLTRLDETAPQGYSNIVGVIFIARDPKWTKNLDEAEISSLGRIQIKFNPYTSKQLKDILMERSKIAFKPGVVSEEVIDFIADVSSTPPINGDARYALDLLLYSGIIAEQRGSQRIKAEHVRLVHSNLCPTITSEDINELPQKLLYLLFAVAKTLKTHQTPYVHFNEIKSTYQIICETNNIKPVRDLYEALDDLAARELITIKGFTKIGISGVTTEALLHYIDDIIGRIEKIIENS